MDDGSRTRITEVVKRYTRGLTQDAIAYRLSARLGRTVKQPVVSAHFKGERWTLDWFRTYAEVFEIPVSEQHRALNLPRPLGDSTEEQPALPSLDALIRADETLSDAAKEHLLTQYGLLQLASEVAQRRADEEDEDESPPLKLRA